MELLDRTVDGLVVERGPPEELPDPTTTGDSGLLRVVSIADDHDPLDVGERALALPLGIAGEAAGDETACAPAAPARDPREGSDGSVGADRSGEPADRFAADVAQRAARQQANVAARHTRRPQRLECPAGGPLAGI